MTKKPKPNKNDKSLAPGTIPARREKQEKRPPVTKGYRGKNDEGIPPILKPSPRRRRTLKKAFEIVDKIYRPGERRREAYESIRRSKQPVRRARLIAKDFLKEQSNIPINMDTDVNLSDVQELTVKLIRRDFGIWSPQREYLMKIERTIVTVGMTREVFETEAATLWSIPQILPKKFRQNEWLFSRTWGR
jgi:hypothetical protein